MKKKMGIIAVILVMTVVLSSCASSAKITADEAKTVALQEAGVTAEAAEGLTAHLERDDGRAYYEVDFYVGGVEYDVEVDAKTGEIVKYDREGEATTTAAPTTTTTAATEDTPATTTTTAATEETPATTTKAALAVSEEDAEQTALADAGFAADTVTRLMVQLEYDDGKPQYDVEFFKDGVQYEYEIDAETGAILSKDIDNTPD